MERLAYDSLRHMVNHLAVLTSEGVVCKIAVSNNGRGLSI